MKTIASHERPDAGVILKGLSRDCDRRDCSCRRAASKGSGLAHCPAHEDHKPSLSVTPNSDKAALVHCHAGCEQPAVIAALRERGLWPAAHERRGGARSTSNGAAGGVGGISYSYISSEGELIATKQRIERPGRPKTFQVLRPDGGRSSGDITIAALPLYRLPDLLAAAADVPVLLLEGEKDVDSARTAGFVAVTTAGGAAQADFGGALEPLAGRDVVLVPDRDQPGHAYMRRLRERLTTTARRLRWLDLPGVPEKGDLSDWLAAGGTVGALQTLIDAAPAAASHGPGCDLCGEAGAPVEGGDAPEPLPPFPVAVLPDLVREVVTVGARAVDCPPDFIAVPLLAVAGALIGNQVAIEIKRNWQEYPILWSAVVGRPGTAKSAALDVSIRRLSVLQREAREAFKREKEAYEAELLAWKAVKGQTKRGPRPVEPQMEHFYTADYTIEALTKMLGHDESCTPGLVIVTDELVSWVANFDQYKATRNGERSRWLSLWSGGAIKSDRAGRGEYYIENPVLPVTGGIQPDRLPALQEEAEVRDGFLDRMLFAWPAARTVRFTRDELAPALTDALTDLFRGLRHTTRGTVTLPAATLDLWENWQNSIADEVDRSHGLMSGVLAKMPRQVARLALVLHMLHHPDDGAQRPLTPEMLMAAIDLGSYFGSHAARVMEQLGEAAAVARDPLTVRVTRLLRAAAEEGRGWLSRTELHRGLGGSASATALTQTLAALARSGLAISRPLPPGEAGGRPGEAWRAVKPTPSEETEITEETPGDGGEEGVNSVSSVSSNGQFPGGAGAKAPTTASWYCDTNPRHRVAPHVSDGRGGWVCRWCVTTGDATLPARAAVDEVGVGA